jgi:surfactin synthase thioesterase subunit
VYATLEQSGATLMQPDRSVWTEPACPDGARPKLRLYCFPYAGAGAAVFRPWWNEISRGIEVCGIQLPGRGVRFLEPRYTRVKPLVRALADDLWPLPDLPFALFGHSLGALLAFEFARELRRRGHEPMQLIVSGLPAPQMSAASPRVSNLPEAEFLAALKALNGIPEQLLGEPEFLRIMLPVLRDDFEMLETYTYEPEPPLACRISAYAGRNDPRSPVEDLIFWRPQTSGGFSCRIFPGGHFFIDTGRRALLSAVSVDLLGTFMTCQAQNHRPPTEPSV